MTDDLITDHAYEGELGPGASCQHIHYQITGIKGLHGGFENHEYEKTICARQAMEHANPGSNRERHLLYTHPHDFVPQKNTPSLCDYGINDGDPGSLRVCGYPERLHRWAEYDRYMASKKNVGALVRQADAAQYERAPMPDAARRGPVVTLIDAPVDPLGTLAVIGGIYTGQVARSKAEVTDEQRRAMLADMQKTTLDGPLEAIQFTFLLEGVSRSFTHQAVRNRFSFFAQESLRFAVAEDWAQEVPLPPFLAQARDEDPAVGVWRKAMNQSEDNYNTLVALGMPAEEARDVLVHAIPTRYYWTVSLRTLLQEAGKRTCTQAQFHWRQAFAGVAKVLRERGNDNNVGGVGSANYWRAKADGGGEYSPDGWQYRAFADLIRPVCYQQGKCGFMAKFDRGCTIRARVDAFEREGVPSADWHRGYAGKGLYYAEDGTDAEGIPAINPAEWAADPGAART